MDVNFLLNKATKLHLKGKFEQAETIYKKIIKFDQNNIIAINNLASVLNYKKNYETAIPYLDNALKIKPDFIDALNNKAVSLRGLNSHHEALIYCEKALEINPGFVDALNNKANCLRSMDLLDEAIIYYEKTLQIKPNLLEAIYNKSFCLYLQKRYDESLLGYKHAIKLKPDFVEANYNLSLIQLIKGNYEEGWKNYEWRKKRNKDKKHYSFVKGTEWIGDKDLKDKTIYITKEQGLGDYIQYCRYLPMIKKLGAKIILDTPNPLRSIIDTMSIDYTHIDDLKKIVFDFRCSIASLPLAFNTTLKTIPSNIPYLFTPKEIKKYWQKKLKSTKKKIGLKWSGNTSYDDDENRSTSLETFKPLFDLPYDFHSLQIEYTEKDEKLMNDINNLNCHKKEIIGFDNTAGLIDSMDLIISVDTGIVQLCGALGKPFWNLLTYTSDYRWLLDRDDSPWFPTAKLYRQTKRGGWKSMIKKVKEDLKNIKSF